MTQPQKLYLNLIITSLILLGLFFGLGWPMIRTIKVKAENLAKKQQSIQTLYQNWQNLEKAKRNLKTQFDIETLEQILLEKDQAVDLIFELETMAQKAGCHQEIKSSVLTKKQKEEVSELRFQITLWCPLTKFFKFLIYFENMKYFAEVQNLQLMRLDAKAVENEKEISGLSGGDIRAVLDISAPIKEL